ncbi:MAG: anthranilate synthase component I family protein, partial [Thermodesulfobacteriota bacterium]
LIKNKTSAHVNPSKGLTSLKIETNLSKDEYSAMIKKALAYIAAGDIYQINLSRRLKIPIKKDPFEIYSSMTAVAPSRFPCFFDCGGFQILSNSPERFLRVTGRKAETEPIKGTRPRGKNPIEDRTLIEELKKSPKENSEHVMIVDLGRNDIGRISEPDTVKVESFKRIETYPSLHHMVSTISGTLKSGIGPAEAIKFMFPGGSVTGAPKIRAMELIEELEPLRRGLYTGAMGYIDLCGDMDLSMIIRTAIAKDGSLDLSVGGGIVADSNPEEEYLETEIKAADFLKVTQKKEAMKRA